MQSPNETDFDRLKQSWLIEYINPMEKRLGKSFFQSLPQRPGVYLFLDTEDRILYIGKSKNLSQRLKSYRHARPDNVSKKVIRLIEKTWKVAWEETKTHQSAVLRENKLLRTHKPPFNVANTHTETYCFIGFQISARRLILRLDQEYTLPADPSPQLEYYGAFKNRALARNAYGALLRATSYLTQHPTHARSPHLLKKPYPSPFSVEFNQSLYLKDIKEIEFRLRLFLNGESMDLLEYYSQKALGLSLDEIDHLEKVPNFDSRIILDDIRSLAHFYEVGPSRNQLLLKTKKGNSKKKKGSPQIAHDEIDDLLTLHTFQKDSRSKKKEPPSRKKVAPNISAKEELLKSSPPPP